MGLFQKASCDWLVVGLGNPGAKYARSRHNAGFCALELLAKDAGTDVKKEKFQALTALCTVDGQKLLLMKPQTFMNLSGTAVKLAADYYKIPPQRVLVLFDDISLPPGRIRIRPSGSAGGHNGVKSLIACLGSDQFPRVKIGVGAKPDPEYDLADWVLGSIPKEEQESFDRALENAAKAARCILKDGCDQAAARYNGK